VGAKGWMLFYADRDGIPAIMREGPALDRAETVALVERLFGARRPAHGGWLTFARESARRRRLRGLFPGAHDCVYCGGGG
jgi:hypothetical protein